MEERTLSQSHLNYVTEFCTVLTTLYGPEHGKSYLLNTHEYELLHLLSSTDPALAWRMVCILSRKVNYLPYPEHTFDENILERLVDLKVLSPLAPEQATSEALLCLPKKRLQECFQKLGMRVFSSKTKQWLCVTAMNCGKVQEIARQVQLYRILRKEEFNVLQVLFFGKLHETFGRFFARDFRGVTSSAMPIHFAPIVANREQLEALLEMETLRQSWHRVVPENIEFICQKFQDLRKQEYLGCPHLKVRCERATRNLAKLLECEHRYQEAITLYSQDDSYKGISDTMRLLKKTGDRAAAESLAQTVYNKTNSSNGKLYVHEYLAGEKRSLRPPVLRTILRKARTVELDRASDQGVEADVCMYLKHQATEAFHVENLLFNYLYEVFCITTLPDVLPHNTLQPYSHVVYQRDFYKQFKNIIEPAIADLSIESLCNYGKCCSAYTGRADIARLCNRFLSLTTVTKLQALLHEIILSPHEHLSGYPDLIAFKECSFSFIEVKGPNDTVRIEQHAAMQRLKRVGYEVEVYKVTYRTATSTTARTNH